MTHKVMVDSTWSEYRKRFEEAEVKIEFALAQLEEIYRGEGNSAEIARSTYLQLCMEWKRVEVSINAH